MKIRINQGVSIIVLALAILILSAFSKPLKSIELVGWFLLGVGLARLNDYWGENERKK